MSPPGGLYMSFILRPGHVDRPELASLIAALAVVQGVKDSTGISTQIRWPNDVMIKGKKLAGVISEAQYFKQEITQILVGIGLNCNARIGNSGDNTLSATSLADESGSQVELLELRHSILESFSSLYENWKAGEDMLPLWQANLGTLGKAVTVKLKTEETPFSSFAKGIDSSGGLVMAEGKDERILRPEDVEWLREKS